MSLNPLVIGSMVLTIWAMFSATEDSLSLNPLVIGSIVLTYRDVYNNILDGSSQSPRNRVNSSHD